MDIFWATVCRLSQHFGIKKLRGAAVVEVVRIGYWSDRHTVTDSDGAWQVVIRLMLVQCVETCCYWSHIDLRCVAWDDGEVGKVGLPTHEPHYSQASSSLLAGTAALDTKDMLQLTVWRISIPYFRRSAQYTLISVERSCKFWPRYTVSQVWQGTKYIQLSLL